MRRPSQPETGRFGQSKMLFTPIPCPRGVRRTGGTHVAGRSRGETTSKTQLTKWDRGSRKLRGHGELFRPPARPRPPLERAKRATQMNADPGPPVLRTGPRHPLASPNLRRSRRGSTWPQGGDRTSSKADPSGKEVTDSGRGCRKCHTHRGIPLRPSLMFRMTWTKARPRSVAHG